MESASAHVPVVAISSQIPRDLIGRGRGFLHDLPDQRASFAPIVKRAWRAESAAGPADLLAEAWRTALAPPSGPVYLEVPVDVLDGPAAAPELTTLDGTPRRGGTPDLARRRGLLQQRRAPGLWAGGGVERSGASAQLRRAGRALHAPVATTYMGKGAFPADHPLAAGSACDDGAYQDLLHDARRRALRRAPSSAPRPPASTSCASRGGSSRSTPPQSGSAPPTRRWPWSATPPVLDALTPLVTEREANGHARAARGAGPP